MDTLNFIIILLNLCILLISILESFFKIFKHEKKYINLNNQFANSLLKIDNKMTSETYNKILKESCYNINTKQIDNISFSKRKNKYYIYFIMKQSYIFFSDLYNDKNIYCNLKIIKNHQFYSIAHFRNNYTSTINDRTYVIARNTDLMNIFENNYNKFIISNIKDYKEDYTFLTQNIFLKNTSNAIITISLREDVNLLGCYTIYFSKPLDDKINLCKLEKSICVMIERFSELIKEYIKLNSDNLNIDDNPIIENKLHKEIS